MRPNLIIRNMANVRREASQQCLADIGMQLRFKLREVHIQAAQNPFFDDTLLDRLFQKLGHVLEMLARFILYAALCMTGVVARKAVAAPATGQWMEQVFALGQFAQAEIKQTSAMAV